MTKQELASKFTPPDPKLAAIRNFIISKLEKDVAHANKRIMIEPELARRQELRQWQNGLVFALYSIRGLIDGDGKILWEDLYPELEHLFKEKEANT